MTRALTEQTRKIESLATQPEELRPEQVEQARGGIGAMDGSGKDPLKLVSPRDSSTGLAWEQPGQWTVEHVEEVST